MGQNLLERNMRQDLGLRLEGPVVRLRVDLLNGRTEMQELENEKASTSPRVIWSVHRRRACDKVIQSGTLDRKEHRHFSTGVYSRMPQEHDACYGAGPTQHESQTVGSGSRTPSSKALVHINILEIDAGSCGDVRFQDQDVCAPNLPKQAP